MPAPDQETIQPVPLESAQSISLHGPYEDAIIAACNVIEKIVEGQDAATRKELWDRYLELTRPLHNAAVEAAKSIERFFKAGR